MGRGWRRGTDPAARGKEGDSIRVEGTTATDPAGKPLFWDHMFSLGFRNFFCCFGLRGWNGFPLLPVPGGFTIPSSSPLTLSTSLYNVASLNSPSIERAIQLLPVFRPHITRLGVSFYGTEIKFCSPLNLHSTEHEVCGKLYRDGEGRKG